MQFVAGFEAAIVWVWYVLGVVAAIALGALAVLVVAVVVSVAFDKASDAVAELRKRLREGRHGKE